MLTIQHARRTVTPGGFVAAIIILTISLMITTLAGGRASAAIPSGFVISQLPTGQNETPTDFSYAPDNSYFTAGKNGRVAWVSASGTARTLAQLSVVTVQDLGLTGLAVAKDYATSKKIYTARTLLVNGQWVMRLSSWTVTGSPEPTGLASEQILFDLPANSDVHSMSGIHVDTDGSLWISIGDSADFRFVDPLALRALDITQGYGKILHISPLGSGISSNPYYEAAHPNSWKSRMYASGFRSPFRFSLDPTTGTPIVGDVGWETTEEVNLIRPGASYGWPCWEGNNRTPGYKDLAGCTGVANAGALWSYVHGPLGTSVTGGIVYTGSNYPAQYRGSYFFGDYASGRVYTLAYNTQGSLTRAPESDGFISGNGAPVKFGAAANGDIVYVDIGNNSLKRISYAPGNRTPTAKASTQTNPATRTVQFNGSMSSDPDGDSLTYTWDFGDGSTGTGVTASHTYAAPGTTPLDATLTVRDPAGASHAVTIKVVPANNSPVLTLTTPPAGTLFKVGDAVALQAAANDLEDGALTIHWSTMLVHCSGGYCHNHPGESFDGPSYNRAFSDHGDATHLEITATAYDQHGVTTQKTYTAQPKLRTLTVTDNTPAAVTINGSARPSATITVGANVSLIAPVTAVDGVATFEHWENGTSRTRNLTMPDSDLSVKATYMTPIERRVAGDAGYQPTGPEVGDSSLRYQNYTNGVRIYWTPRSGVHIIHGSILQKYLATGAHVAWGEPTTDETSTPDGTGRYNHFYGGSSGVGSIYWTPSTGAQLIYGSIRDLWASMDWERSVHGYPTSDEASTPSGNARYNNFQNGGIYWTPSGGAKSVHGGIYAKWAAHSWEQGFLGLPLTNETSTPDGIGRYNHFVGGSIYWSPGTGAYEVHGSIRDRWSARGWEGSYLGYPTSDEFNIPGGKRSNFQRGYITWNASNGQVIDRAY